MKGLVRLGLAASVAAALAVSWTGARAECRLAAVAQFPVEVQRGRILIPSEVNGRKVYFIFDTGGMSFLFSSGAKALGLATHNVSTTQLQARYFGIGGEFQPAWPS